MSPGKCRDDCPACLRSRIAELEKERDQWQESSGQNYVRAQEAEACEEKLQAENDRLMNWLGNNTTFQSADESNAVLASVSNRIWYHATDDTTTYPFSALVRKALKESGE